MQPTIHGRASQLRRGLASTLLAATLVVPGTALASAAPAPATAEAPSPTVSDIRKVTLGVGMVDGRDMSDLDGFRSDIAGTRVRLWTICTDWGNKGFTPIVKRLKQVSGKRIVAAAIASAPGGGNRARWIRRGYTRVYDQLKRVKVINDLNVDLSGPRARHRDWSLSGSSLTAHAAIASKPRFKGRIR